MQKKNHINVGTHKKNGACRTILHDLHYQMVSMRKLLQQMLWMRYLEMAMMMMVELMSPFDVLDGLVRS